MKRKINQLAGLVCTAIILLCLLIPFPALAADSLKPPHAFYGELTLTSGGKAPAGVTVIAKINGKQVGESLKTVKAGQYGGPNLQDKCLIVQGDIEENTPIEFYVNGKLATSSDENLAVFHSGAVTKLDLVCNLPSSSGGGGSGSDGEIDVDVDGAKGTASVNRDGKSEKDLKVVSLDGKVELTILQGTTVLGADGNIPPKLTITPDPNAPEPPERYRFLTIAYQCQPDGVTFAPPIKLKFTYELEEGVNAADLKVVFYNSQTNTWEAVPFVLDEESRTITAAISHFSYYAVLAPAAGGDATPTETATPTPTETITPTATETAVPTDTSPDETKPINWGLIIGVIAGVAVVGGAIAFRLLRRKGAGV